MSKHTAVYHRRKECATEARLAHEEVRKTAKELEDNIVKLAKMATKKAGLDPHIMSLHLHNCQVGERWTNIDYNMVALADTLLNVANHINRMDTISFYLYEIADPSTPEFCVNSIERMVMFRQYPF